MQTRPRDPLRRARGLTLALTCALMAAGCGKGAEATFPQITRTAKKAPPAEPGVDPAVTEALRTMVGGVGVGNATAPVDVRFALAQMPMAGVPFTLEVAVLPQAPSPVLRIEVRGGEGLAISEPSGPVQLEKVQAGTVQRLKVVATSTGTGTRVIGVTATLELPTGPEGREYAFPVVVGLSAAGAAAAGATTAGAGAGTSQGPATGR